MNVEREIAGFALSFAAGVIVTAYVGASFCIDPALLSNSAFAVIFIPVFFLLYWTHQGVLPSSKYIILFHMYLAAIGCGILSAATGLLLDVEMPPTLIETSAVRFGLKMKAAIDALPFKNPESGALIKALLTGDRSSLPADTINSFRASGASHILALSGLHLGIIYVIISKSLRVFGNSIYARFIRSIAAICICGFYTLATGAGPSIVRAFLFILLKETAQLTGRFSSLKQVFFASLIIQLIISPLSARSVGFQLSYAATAGIAFIYPQIKEFWLTETYSGLVGIIIKTLKWIWNSAALSISCQITTGPLAYLYFGSFPTHFTLTNLISLPLTGILIPCAVLTLCLGVLGWCPDILIVLTETLCKTMTWSLRVISTM